MLFRVPLTHLDWWLAFFTKFPRDFISWHLLPDYCDHSNETSLPVLSNGAICFQNFAKRNLGIFVEFCPCPQLALKGLKGRVNHSNGRFSVLIWLSWNDIFVLHLAQRRTHAVSCLTDFLFICYIPELQASFWFFRSCRLLQNTNTGASCFLSTVLFFFWYSVYECFSSGSFQF